MSTPEEPKQTRAKEVLLSTLTTETSLPDALARAMQGTGASQTDASRALYGLLEAKKVTLTDPSPPGSTIEYLGRAYSFWFWGRWRTSP